jgi:hypothetical protein
LALPELLIRLNLQVNQYIREKTCPIVANRFPRRATDPFFGNRRLAHPQRPQADYTSAWEHSQSTAVDDHDLSSGYIDKPQKK